METPRSGNEGNCNLMKAVRWHLGLFGAVIVGLALAARLWKLSEQSMSFDEFHIGLAYLQAPNLKTYLSLVGLVGPAGLSLYHVLLYGWVNHVGDSLYCIRLIGVLGGALAALFAFLTARHLYGTKAGLLAGGMSALSPMLVWHSQSARPYFLLSLMGILCMYTMIRAWEGNSRAWWMVNILTNVLIVFAHLYGVFVVCTELFFVIAFRWRRIRSVAPWLLLKFLSLAFAAPSVLGMPVYYKPWGSAGLIRGLVCPILCNDVANWNTDIPPRWPMNVFSVTSPWTWIDLVLPLFFLTALSCAAWRFSLTVLKGEGEEKRQVQSLPPLIAVLPAFAMFFWAEFLNFGNETPRYTIFIVNGVHLTAAGWVFGLRKNRRALGVAVCLMLLFGYQLYEVMDRRTRPDWMSAAALIREQAGPSDVVIATGYAGASNMLEDSAGDLPLPIVGADSPRSACDAVLYFLSLTEDPTAQTPTTRRAWLVIDTGFDRSPLSFLESALDAYGLSFEANRFLGGENLHVYKIRQAGKPGAGEIPVRLDCSTYYNRVDIGYACGAVMPLLDKSSPLASDENRLWEFLDRICVPFGGDWPDMMWWALASLEYGQPALAEALGQHVMLSQRSPTGDFAYGCVLAYQDNMAEARGFFQQAARLRAVKNVLSGFVNALEKPDNLPQALAEVDKLETYGLTYLLRGLRSTCYARFGKTAPKSIVLPVGVYVGRHRQADLLQRFASQRHWMANNSASQLYALGYICELANEQGLASTFYAEAAKRSPNSDLLQRWAMPPGQRTTNPSGPPSL